MALIEKEETFLVSRTISEEFDESGRMIKSTTVEVYEAPAKCGQAKYIYPSNPHIHYDTQSPGGFIQNEPRC